MDPMMYLRHEDFQRVLDLGLSRCRLAGVREDGSVLIAGKGFRERLVQWLRPGHTRVSANPLAQVMLNQLRGMGAQESVGLGDRQPSGRLSQQQLQNLCRRVAAGNAQDFDAATRQWIDGQKREFRVHQTRSLAMDAEVQHALNAALVRLDARHPPVSAQRQQALHSYLTQALVHEIDHRGLPACTPAVLNHVLRQFDAGQLPGQAAALLLVGLSLESVQSLAPESLRGISHQNLNGLQQAPTQDLMRTMQLLWMFEGTFHSAQSDLLRHAELLRHGLLDDFDPCMTPTPALVWNALGLPSAHADRRDPSRLAMQLRHAVDDDTLTVHMGYPRDQVAQARAAADSETKHLSRLDTLFGLCGLSWSQAQKQAAEPFQAMAWDPAQTPARVLSLDPRKSPEERLQLGVYEFARDMLRLPGTAAHPCTLRIRSAERELYAHPVGHSAHWPASVKAQWTQAQLDAYQAMGRDTPLCSQTVAALMELTGGRQAQVANALHACAQAGQGPMLAMDELWHASLTEAGLPGLGREHTAVDCTIVQDGEDLLVEHSPIGLDWLDFRLVFRVRPDGHLTQDQFRADPHGLRSAMQSRAQPLPT